MQQFLGNRFAILQELGRGNMGTVYRVQDTLQGDQEVALKTIRSETSITPELRLQFKEEFRAMAKLKHPNTIEVFDFGQLDDHTQFLTMEIVPGVELAELIHGRQLTLPKTYDLLIQLLQALGFIHASLFVHRDIKAENIRVREDGTLKLMDFGLMGQLGVQSNGKITGTPAYLPPEVPKGGVIDAGSDLYSVGCLAFQMLTGHLPFEGNLIDVIRAHVSQPAPSLRSLRPDLPPQLDAIVARLLAKDPRQRYTQAAEVIEDLADLGGVIRHERVRDQRKSYLVSSVLVGREHEFAQLQQALDKARAGSAQACFIGAPAGVGKSRLAHELVLHAKLNEVAVLHGQCMEAGTAPYEPILQALRPLIPVSTEQEIATFGPVLLALYPELAREGLDRAPALPGPADKARLGETLVRWVESVAQHHPLLVFMDDLQWCDSESFKVFNALIRQLRTSALFCLATFRNEEVPPSSPLWYTVDEGLTQYLKLNLFNIAQTVALLQAMLREVQITRGVCQRLYEATSGNAFFLTEILRYLMEEGSLVLKEAGWSFPTEAEQLVLPSSVEGTVMRRLGQLSVDAKGLAKVASVLGRYQTRDMLLFVSGLDENALFGCLDELIERQFIMKDEDRYTFPHDRVREALYHDLSAEERRQLHERCGCYLEQRGDQAPLTELAYHFSHGADKDKAYRYLRQAADVLFKDGIAGQALGYYKQAEALLEGLERPDRLAEQRSLWSALMGYVGMDWSAAGLGAEKLLASLEADPTASPDAFFRPYNTLGGVYAIEGNPLRADAIMQRAEALLDPASPARQILTISKCGVYFYMGNCDRAVREAAEAVARIQDPEADPFLFCVLSYVVSSRAFQGYAVTMEDLSQAMQVAEKTKQAGATRLLPRRAAVGAAWAGRWELAEALLDVLERDSRRMGAPPSDWSLYLRAFIAWQHGEFEQAAALVAHAYRYPHIHSEFFITLCMERLEAHLMLSEGEMDRAAEAFARIEQKSRDHAFGLVTIQCLLDRGEVEIARLMPAEARGLLLEAHRLSAAGELRNPMLQTQAARLLGHASLLARDFDDAKGYLDEAMRIASDPEQDNRLEQGHVLRCWAELRLSQGDQAGAEAAFREAQEIFRKLNNRHLQRGMAARRAAIHQSEAPIESEVAPRFDASTQRSVMITQWQSSFADAVAESKNEEDYRQVALRFLIEKLDADEASWFDVGPTLSWRTTCLRHGDKSDPPQLDPLILDVLEDGQGRVGISLPSDLTMSVGTNLDSEMHSLAVCPVLDDLTVIAIVTLTRTDLGNPLDEPALEALSALCGLLGRVPDEQVSGSRPATT